MFIRGGFGAIFSRSTILIFGDVLVSGRLMATELEPYEFVAAQPGTTALIGYLVYADHPATLGCVIKRED
jgi:hypothetical protein